MRDSLLLRLLALSLVVATLSIAATAWLTVRDTNERLAGGFDRTLEADGFIYQRLLTYAREHRSWDHVAPVLEELTEQTGRRIALATGGGEVLADSAALTGQGSQELPPEPAADIDARLTSISFTRDAAPQEPVRLPPDWQQTPQERERRSVLAARATECLQRNRGTDRDVFTVPYGGELTISDQGAQFSPTNESSRQPRASRGPAGRLTFTPSVIRPGQDPPRCVPPGLYRLSDAARQLTRTEIDLFTACLDRMGLPYEPLPIPGAMPTVFADPVREYDQAALSKWNNCASTARAKAIEPFVANSALLYLGSADQFNAFSGEAWVRTVLTGLSVLAVATAITVLAGRRLTRPIRALTGAVQRMEAGDRSARVPIRGRDEVAQLGHAFNAMAESIDEGERQREAMVSDVAHELRTPLANIRGYLEAAEDGVVPLDPELIASLQEDSSLLQRLVDDLQDLALAEAGMLRLYPEEQDAAHLVRQTVAAHRARADDAHVSLRAETPESVPVHVDPTRLRQAIGNLVTNAVQYTPAGGEVSVSAGAQNGEVVLSVTDSGPGIAPEHLPHLFERFYRAETSRSRETGGSGLGLAITRHLVEAHGGSVAATSTKGAGSVFTIRLPAHK